MSEKLVNPSKRQWIMLVILTVAASIPPFLMYCYVTQSEFIMTKYALNYTQWAALGTSYSIACGAGLFIVRMLVKRFGCKLFIMTGIFLMILAHVIFLLAPDFEILLIARFVSGFGNACIYNAIYTLAVLWFQDTNRVGVAAGAMTAADGIGTFAALYLYALLIGSLGWDKGSIYSIVIMAVLLVLLQIFLKNAPASAANETAAGNDKLDKYTNVMNRNTIAHSLAVSGVLGGLGLANFWGPTILIEQGMSSATAGLLSSLFTAVGIFSGLIFGGISDKFGKRKPPMLIGGIGMVISYVLLIFGNVSENTAVFTLALMICGFCGYIVYPIGFALISDTVCTKALAASNGVIQGSSFLIGLMAYQQIVGIIKDVTETYWIGFAVCAVLTLLLNVIAVIVFAKDKDVQSMYI